MQQQGCRIGAAGGYPRVSATDLLSSVENDVRLGNESMEGMQKCSRSVPQKLRNGFKRNERALERVLGQRYRKDAGGKKITRSSDRYEAHEESKLITERKDSYCERKVFAGEAERAINEGEQQNEAVESRRGFVMKIGERKRSYAKSNCRSHMCIWSYTSHTCGK